MLKNSGVINNCGNMSKNYASYEKFSITGEMSMVFNFSQKNNGSKFVISMFTTSNVDLFIANLDTVLLVGVAKLLLDEVVIPLLQNTALL